MILFKLMLIVSPFELFFDFQGYAAKTSCWSMEQK